MGYNSMAAWDRFTDFQFHDQVKQRGGVYIEKHIVECRSERSSGRTSPNEDDQLSSPSTATPSFRNVTSYWSPPTSPRPMSIRSSPANSPPTSPRTDSARPYSSGRPAVTAKEMNRLADKLYAAACAGDLDHVRLLLSLGAPINAGTMVQGLYVTFKPAKAGFLCPLAGAASHGQFQMAQLLILKGASVNPTIQQSSSSALHLACLADDLEMARFLLDSGADVELSNCYKSTPVSYAAKYSSADLLQLLLAYGPDLHKASFIGAAPIHVALDATYHKPANVELLLQAGADPNHVSPSGQTPLHWAVTTARNLDAVISLLRHRADPLRRDDERKTPLNYAEENGLDDLAAVLREAEAAWRAHGLRVNKQPIRYEMEA